MKAVIQFIIGKSSAFHLPSSRTSGEYDFNTDQRRQSLVMSTSRVNSPRHHPYMSPGKVYTPSLMSSLQSYRSTSQQQQQQEDVAENNDNTSTNDNTNRYPW
jgi:hypothetical protein